MARIVEAGFIGATVFAVLAFGGTEPVSFSIVQSLLLGLAVVHLASDGIVRFGNRSFPVVVPSLLVLLVLLQIVPIPGLLVQLIRGAGSPTTGSPVATVSIVPYATLAHLLQLLTYLAAFYLTLAVCQSSRGKRRLFLALFILGMFEGFYGLIQYLTGWQQIFTYVKKYNLFEATGTYINRNHFAGLLEMILPFALALAFYEFGKLRRSEPMGSAHVRSLLSQQDFQKLVFWLFLATILFVALIFSHSRMGIISTLAATLVMITLLATSGKQRRTGVVITLLFVSGGLLLAIWIGPEPVLDRFEILPQEYAVSGEGRWAIWQDTLRLIGQHPWLGSGLGTFPVAYTSTQTAFLSFFVNHAHNDYLEIFSDLGLLGGGLLFGSVCYVLLQLIRFFGALGEHFDQAIALACVGSITAILWHSLTDFNLYIPGNALVFSSILGMGCSVMREQIA